MFGQSECSILTYLRRLKTFLVIRDLCQLGALIDLSPGCLQQIRMSGTSLQSPVTVISHQTRVSAAGLIRLLTISTKGESLSPNIGHNLSEILIRSLSVSHGCEPDGSGPNFPKYVQSCSLKYQNRTLTHNQNTNDPLWSNLLQN